MKKLFVLLLSACMVLSLAACADSQGPVRDDPAPTEAKAPAVEAPAAAEAPAETAKDYSGYTIRIYSNSNSTERTTWLINEANASGRRCASTVFIMAVSGLILYLVYGVGARDLGERLEARDRRRKRIERIKARFGKKKTVSV